MNADNKKDCLVVMPVEEFSTEYKTGHFRKVYENIIKPSVLKAGFNPVSSYDFVLHKVDYATIINKIMNASIVIFDLSSYNKGVITGLKIRNAFANKAILTLKDDQTSICGDMKNSRFIEYATNFNYSNLIFTRLLISLSLLDMEKTESNEQYLN